MGSRADTIAAISTARGRAPRGVVRLSGTRAFDLVAARSREFAAAPRPSRAVAIEGTWSLDPDDGGETVFPGASVPVDVWLFPGPSSYTGEDVAELHLRGAPALLDLVLRLLLADGARAATPGEFTRRAAEAGKLDLARVDGVLAAIRARDDAELARARALLDGGLSKELTSLKERATDLLVPLELSLDFSDQDVEIVAPVDHAARIAELSADVRRLARAEGGSSSRAERRVVLRGPSNAGKSTLFNALVGRPLAIESPARGTTRDPVGAVLRRGGERAVLVDTAGDDVRDHDVDLAAHRARRRALLEADLVLEVRDLRRGEFDRGFEATAPILFVGTFADLAPDAPAPPSTARVAAPLGLGVEALSEAIFRALSAASVRAGDDAPYPVSARISAAAREAADALDSAAAALKTAPPEFAASDLRAALRSLRSVLDPDPNDPVLDRIFRDFCIGK